METTPPVVLVVDDEPVIRSLLAERLDLAGYEVIEASSGAEAIEIMGSDRQVKAVISDVQMPGVDGFALARWFAKHAPTVRVMLTSGKISPLKMRKLMPEVRFFPKPFRLSTVVQELDDFTGRHDIRP